MARLDGSPDILDLDEPLTSRELAEQVAVLGDRADELQESGRLEEARQIGVLAVWRANALEATLRAQQRTT